MSPGIAPPARLPSYVWQLLLIVASGLWVYSPVLHGGWLWDDNMLITQNPLVRDPDGLWKIWTDPAALYDYYPITYTAQRFEWNLFGMDTLGYHLVNIVLHIISALLVWRLFSKLGLRQAWWGGLLFAVHPVMVESVAWIAELKNTLSLPPLLMAMCCWVDYEERATRGNYLSSLGWFLVAILCKTTVFVFPVLILLFAWWKRARIDLPVLKASVPFFLIAFLFVGIQIAHPHDQAPYYPWAPLSRLSLVGSSLAFYLFISLCPVGLAPIYPPWPIIPLSFWQVMPLPLLAGLTWWFWTKWATWGRNALLGWGYFFLTLLPFAGVLPAPTMYFTWVMDHFLYVPIIGLIGLVVAGGERLAQILPGWVRPGLVATGVVVTVLLAWGSHAYAGIFSSSETLWSYALQRNPASWIARNNLGEALAQQGRSAEAMALFQSVIALQPDYFAGHFDLAHSLSRAKRYEEAIPEYESTVKLQPKFGTAYFEWGAALEHVHRTAEASAAYEKAVQVEPGHADAHAALGHLLSDAHQIPQAFEEYRQAIELAPNRVDFRRNVGNFLLQVNQVPAAAEQLKKAVEISPNDAAARSDLGVALARLGRFPEAMAQVQAALQIDPNDAGAHNNMGSLFLVAGQLPKAAEEYQAALRIKPDFAEAQKNLARVQELQKQPVGTKPKP